MNTLILTPEAMFQGDLLLVNPSFPHHPLPHPDLVTVADTDILLERRAAQALDSLMAAIGGWKEIVPVSGWRALEEQQAIWEDSLAENGLPFTQTYVAYPGHSEHQTGLAIDLGRRSASIDFIPPRLSLYRALPDLPPGDGPVRPDPAVPRRERGDHRHRP